MNEKVAFTKLIKDYAISIGFDACGLCCAKEIETESQFHLSEWLNNGYQASMEYLASYKEKRINPTLLVDNAKTIISLALNYYPPILQDKTAPQFAYYAYGKDYHEVMKDKLQLLFTYIKYLLPKVEGRIFVDTAPILERYWAAKAGIGFIGKNTLLIIPKKGSYFFLGEIIIDTELEYDEPLKLSCGNCKRCIEACPTKAIEKQYLLNAKKCISYQTIENKGEIAIDIIPKIENNIYGCDICQHICPWNQFSKPHSIKEFLPKEEFLSIDYDSLERMTIEDYQRIFKGSAVKRAKYTGLMRNLKAIKKSK